ncbi:tetratricopeptide repeat protein [Sorangium sp. So ce1128]
MDAPRSSGTRRALLIGLTLAAVAAAAFLFIGRDERPAPKARPSSAEPSADARPQRHDELSAIPPAPPPAAAAESAAARESEAAPAAPDDDLEARVVDRMRAALTSDPEEVLRLDDAAARDFVDSPRAAERGLLRVRALVRLDRIGQARSLAEDLVERYPDDPSAKSAAAYMGIHPRPRGPSR